jgi:hypothetical protein
MSHFQLRTEDLTWREIDTEVVAVDVSTSMYLSANESGAVLWRLLAAGATRAELTAALEERYGLDAERAESDVEAFIQSLEQRGLLRR